LTIEWFDINGNYEPSNCCFITKKAQSYNKRNSVSNKSRYTGVTWHSRDNIYEVSIAFNCKHHYIGRYKDLKSVVEARNDFIDKNNLPHKRNNMLNKKINEIIRYPEKIPCDKRMHFMIGVVTIAVLTTLTLNAFIVMPFLVALAWGIEFYQKFTKSGTYDNWDAVAVVAGGLIVYASHIL